MTYAAPLHFVDDRLPDLFPVDRSESEWLLTLLSAEELRFIFEGQTGLASRDQALGRSGHMTTNGV